MATSAGTRVDLNADLGESYGRWTLGDDAALLSVVTSANVACGFHAGDPLTLQRTCAAAVAAGVTIGAQVGYPDLAGFGRRFLDMAPDDLTAAVLYQLGALDGLARVAGGRVAYLKPHGALYNATVDHEGQARAVVDAVAAYDPTLPVLGLPGSALLRLAGEAGLRGVGEHFLDRAYTDDGRLVDRRLPGALLHDPDEAAERAVAVAREGRLGSLCTHGDSPGAVAMARTVRAALAAAGIAVAPFVAPAGG
ncbi:LamB/YcsF family protein [Microlunatus capsulatus]|uniref:UPF0271 protein n=1 Tax=Microlunatus capsulatus TaxID=99117 RepID=A0ABS4Z5X5_9ACTN|nr:5-oxoprolinase subunit PxpA [Microlunatus capsulatus]MBP2416391.1 UPF0271 protein [Microlunatus capsulatus]